MGEFNVNKNDGSLVQTAGVPDTYPASQVTYEDTNLNDVLDTMKNHTISSSTAVTLTYNTPYTTTSDGYFKFGAAVGAGNYVSCYVDAEYLFLLPATSGAAAYGSLYVRKGTVIKFSGGSSGTTNGTFYPLA